MKLFGVLGSRLSASHTFGYLIRPLRRARQRIPRGQKSASKTSFATDTTSHKLPIILGMMVTSGLAIPLPAIQSGLKSAEESEQVMTITHPKYLTCRLCLLASSAVSMVGSI